MYFSNDSKHCDVTFRLIIMTKCCQFTHFEYLSCDYTPITVNNYVLTYGSADFPGLLGALSSPFCWFWGDTFGGAAEPALRADLLIRSSSIPLSLSFNWLRD